MKIEKGLKLQSIILLFTLPALLSITAIYAFFNYRTLYNTIMDGFDRKLYSVSTTSASFIDGDEHRNIKDESNPAYDKYVVPMRKILNQAGLTYHYSVVPLEGNKIMYILDSTEGEDHSTAGTTEENPGEEAERLMQAMQSGEASLSDIQEFDIWGQLKIGSAPITNKNGEVTGLIGADVNISVINEKMSKAMLMVFGVGLIACILAMWVSLIIARKFIEPINDIKQAALEVAAGHFGVKAEVTQPQELKQLAETFNQTSLALKEAQISEIQNRREQVDFHALQSIKEIMRFSTFDNSYDQNKHVLQIDPQHCLFFSHNLELYASGFIETGNICVAWFGENLKDSISNHRFKFDVNMLITKILEKYGEDKNQVIESLALLSNINLKYFLLVDKQSSILSLIKNGKLEHTIKLPLESPVEIATNGNKQNSITISSQEEYASS